MGGGDELSTRPSIFVIGTKWKKNMDHVFDVAIIGGGINGCGCAADAALRGLSVVLLEQDDLASKTSSSSTKLIHGGLRYLEHYEFGLVRKALIERQTLLTLAPHIVHPQQFILPYQEHMRSSWFLKLGLYIYDHLSMKNQLPHCQSIERKASHYFDPLTQEFNKGFLFYDAATDDVRLTVFNALQAKNYGASIRTRSRVIKTEILDNNWILTIQPETGSSYQLKAKALINAAGPWVEATAQMLNIPLEHNMTLVKGSHLIVPKLYEGNQAYFLQHQDKRVIFVIPYHGYNMIGTTEVPFNLKQDQIHASEEEINYLLTLVNSYFNQQLNPHDVLYSWSGVRPLIAGKEKNSSQLSRDYNYEIHSTPAPIISILGGKITTYRQLAEEVIDQLILINPKIPSSKTKTTLLPGASLNSMSFKEYCLYAQDKYHWLNSELLNRYLYSYGTNTEIFLSSCTELSSMGICYGAGLYQVEVNYLIEHEWAETAEDILFRRTKLGLSLDKQGLNNLTQYIESIGLRSLPDQAELESH